MNRTFKRCSTVGAGVDIFGAASIAESLFPHRLGCGVCSDEMAVDTKLRGIVPGYSVSAHRLDNSRRRPFLCSGGVARPEAHDPRGAVHSRRPLRQTPCWPETAFEDVTMLPGAWLRRFPQVDWGGAVRQIRGLGRFPSN